MSRADARAEARTSPLRALAELRFRLTVRRFRGKGGVPELVARVALLAMAVPAGLAFAGLAGSGAYRAVRSGAGVGATVGAAALFFGVWQTWTVVAVSLSDREAFDLRRLLVYPVPPSQAYAYELLASFLGDPFALFWSLILLGAFAGAAVGRPGAWLLLLALTHLLFVAAVVAMAALLQELLARALRGRRVRELGVAAIYLGLVALMVWAGGASGGHALQRAFRALATVRWLAYPAALASEAGTALYRGQAARALPWLALLALAALATAWVAYRLALADARSGGEGGSARGEVDARGGRAYRLLGAMGPLVEKEVKYLARHPLALVLGLVVPGIAGVVGWKVVPFLPDEAGEVVQVLPLSAFALYAQLVTQAFWLNAFGWDRGGARLWFLAPVAPADVLRAKNAAARLLALAVFAASAAALVAAGGRPPAWAALAALALHLGIGPWYQAAGNVVSILNPRPGSHTLQRGGSLSPLSALLGMAIFSGGAALFALPALLALRLEEPWALVAGWALLGLAGAAVRRAALPATARLLLRRREQLLAAVAGDDV